MSWIDKEVEQLEEDLENGLISQSEFRQSMSDLRAEMRGEAEEAAEEAYNDAMGFGGW